MPACLSYRPICVALPADSSAKPVIRPSAASWLSCASRSASAVSASRSCACWSGVVPGWAANCASAASGCGLGLAIPGSFPGSGSVKSTDGIHAKRSEESREGYECVISLRIRGTPAYAWGISDWSSDVCSSDLGFECEAGDPAERGVLVELRQPVGIGGQRIAQLRLLVRRCARLGRELRKRGFELRIGFGHPGLLPWIRISSKYRWTSRKVARLPRRPRSAE